MSGPTTPSAKPAAAALAARATGWSPGTEETKPTLSRMVVTGHAAAARAPADSTTSSAATPRRVINAAKRALASRRCTGSSSFVTTSRTIRVGQNARPPRIASNAGHSVAATSRPTSTVSPSPGPKPRNSGEWAAISDAVPAATVSPATVTIGATSAVLSTAAACRSSPSRSRFRIPDRKKTQ